MWWQVTSPGSTTYNLVEINQILRWSQEVIRLLQLLDVVIFLRKRYT